LDRKSTAWTHGSGRIAVLDMSRSIKIPEVKKAVGLLDS